jgi:NAD(P)H-hydrate epimerase
MEAVKQGMMETDAIGYCGEIVAIPIGFESVLPDWEKDLPVLLDETIIHSMLPRRPRTGHKGTFGKGLVVGGCANYSGAPYLAGKAAARVGAGLIQMGVPSFLHPVLAGSFPEATWLLLPEEEGVLSSSGVEILRKQFSEVDGILLGPGLGLEPTTGRLIQGLLQPQTKKSDHIGFLAGDPKSKKEKVHLPPLVIDADGLKLLSKIPIWYALLPEGTILTPHPGEMSILTGIHIDSIQANREEMAVQSAKEWNCVVVLKGAGTVIADPTGRMYRLPLATSALAHAGSGDVLAGLILGLRVQGIPSFESACAAVWIHGMAALSAVVEQGHPAAVLASDIIDRVGPVLASVWSE